MRFLSRSIELVKTACLQLYSVAANEWMPCSKQVTHTHTRAFSMERIGFILLPFKFMCNLLLLPMDSTSSHFIFNYLYSVFASDIFIVSSTHFHIVPKRLCHEIWSQCVRWKETSDLLAIFSRRPFFFMKISKK